MSEVLFHIRTDSININRFDRHSSDFFYHWNGEFAEEFEILKDGQIRFGHARVEQGSLQFFLDGSVHVAQHHHVHEWFLRRLVLDREFVLGIQEVVQRGEDRMRPLRPDELHPMLEVVPWCEVDGGELAKFSAAVASVVANLGNVL